MIPVVAELGSRSQPRLPYYMALRNVSRNQRALSGVSLLRKEIKTNRDL